MKRSYHFGNIKKDITVDITSSGEENARGSFPYPTFIMVHSVEN